MHRSPKAQYLSRTYAAVNRPPATISTKLLLPTAESSHSDPYDPHTLLYMNSSHDQDGSHWFLFRFVVSACCSILSEFTAFLVSSDSFCLLLRKMADPSAEAKSFIGSESSLEASGILTVPEEAAILSLCQQFLSCIKNKGKWIPLCPLSPELWIN